MDSIWCKLRPPAPERLHERPREPRARRHRQARRYRRHVIVGVHRADHEIREPHAAGRALPDEQLVVVQPAHERDEEPLGCGVHGHARRPGLACEGADEEDVYGPGLRGAAELGQEGACEEEGEEGVQVCTGQEGFFGALVDPGWNAYA